MPDNAKPESVYAADVETLREMLKEEQERLADAEQGITDGRALAGYIWNKARATRRIEALTTAIEVMGGAL